MKEKKKERKRMGFVKILSLSLEGEKKSKVERSKNTDKRGQINVAKGKKEENVG